MIFNKNNGRLFLKTLSFVIVIIAIKLLLHFLHFEFITISPFFSGIIAADVFLMGFLLSGVLADFKESEKIPGEMAHSMAAIIYEVKYYIQKGYLPELALKTFEDCAGFLNSLFDWFNRKIKTHAMLYKLEQISWAINEFEGPVQVNHIIRIQNEVANMKRIVIRTDTIRDTDFISSGYLIASISTFLLCIALILAKPEPFYEIFFFVFLISFLLIFLLLLIADLDNPFDYTGNKSDENISLYPLERLQNQIKNYE